MFRYVIYICVIVFGAISSIRAHAEGGVGGDFGMGFYSSIHKNIDTTVDTLRKKELKKYPTFSGFGSHCRGKNRIIDNERMNEDLLIEVSYGNTSRLMNLILKNNGNIDSDSLLNLSTCLAETYRKLGDQARSDENSLSQMSVIGIYTDGSTTNSDYDIIADIEKINSIIFAEKLDYKGTQNSASSSYDALARGDIIPNIMEGMTGVTLSGGIIVASGSVEGSTKTTESAVASSTLSDLGIGSVCSVPTTSSSIGGSAVKNMVDDAFIDDLSTVLGGYNPGGLGTKSYNYGSNLSSTKTLGMGPQGGSDFFDSPPCSGNFCIKIKSVNGSTSALAGGRTYSIESLIEEHSKIMEPISNSNLSAQKHQNNSFQLPFLNIELKKKISGAQVSVENNPQQQKKFKEEYTQSLQDEEFEYMRRCAYASAGLATDINKANIPSGVGYQFLTTHNSATTTTAKKILTSINPDDSSVGVNCMDIALGKSKEEYYASFNTDLTELEVFTSALISQISRGLQADEKLDTLRSK